MAMERMYIGGVNIGGTANQNVRILCVSERGTEKDVGGRGEKEGGWE